MTRITSICIVICLLILCGQTYGQNVLKKNDAQIVLGIESSRTFTSKLQYGMVVEKPIGQLSLGATMHYTQKDHYDRELTSGFSQRSLKTDEVMNTYSYRSYKAEADYLVLGAELKYRLPCNCVFAYANVKRAKAVSYKEDAEDYYVESEYLYHDDTLRKSNLVTGIGLGANFHFSKYFRAVIKFGQESAQEVFESDSGRRKLLRFSVGLHYGFDR